VLSDTSSEASAPRGADIRTFLFADVRGYTRYTREHGDEAASALAAKLAEVVRDVVPAFHGDLFELRGDEAVSVFFSAREAIRAAVELQRRLREHQDGEARFPLGVGMGIDSGEAVPTEGGFRGGALNLAARLCAIAKPGQILVSDHAAHLAGRVDGVRLVDRRPVRLKGIERPVRLVDVVPEVPLPPLPPAVPSVGRHRRGVHDRRWWVAGAVALCSIIVAIAGLLGGDASEARFGGGVAVRANSVAVIDPTDGRVLRDIGVGSSPWDISAGFGAVWVANNGNGTVSWIDPKTMQTQQIPLGRGPTAITSGDGSVWAYDATDGIIYQIDPVSRTLTTSYRVPGCQADTGSAFFGHRSGCIHGGIAAGAGKVWVGNGMLTVRVLDARTGKFTRVPGDAPAHAITYAGGAVFATDSASLARINPSTDQVEQGPTPISIEAPQATLAIDASMSDTLWLAAPNGSVIRVPRHGLIPDDTKPLAPGLNDLVVADNTLWVTNEAAGTLLQINPDNLHVEHTERLGRAPTAVTADDGKIWVTIQDPNTADNQE
jgi:class 3 adenylate cyclase/DNA-binding beta-propeller fold protein YncE